MRLLRATLGWVLVSFAAYGAAPELDRAIEFYRQNHAQDALPLLGRIAQNLDAAPQDRARAYLYGALCRAALGEPEPAHRNFVTAFSLDPALTLPEGLPPELVAQAGRARDEAIAALNVRLGAGARAAYQSIVGVRSERPPAKDVFSSDVAAAPPPGASERPVAGASPTGERAEERKKPEEEEPPPPPPTLLHSHLGVGGHGFYVLGEKSAGPALDVWGGGVLGRNLWLGGIASLLLGNSLAGSLALRLSSYSESPFAYLVGVEAGVLYGGTAQAFSPFLTVHGVGLLIRTPALIIEARLISVGIFLSPAGLRFVPQAGAGVLF